MSDQLAPTSRHAYVSGGVVAYEWSQTIHDVDIYVPLPPGATAKMMSVEISRTSLKFGIKGNPPYLDEKLFGEVVTSDSTWMLEDGELHICLQKATPGEHWGGAIAGHVVDLQAAEADKKRLMLERFQVEHPGFDFTGAEFSGQVPDASKFMGGFSK